MKNILFLLIFAAGIAACNSNNKQAEEELPSQDKLAEEITALQQTLEQQMEQPTLDTATARTMAEKAQDYARRFPQDSLSAKFLFQSANVSRGIGDFELAVQLWGKVHEEYEDYRYAPEALFFQGFTTDNDLQDTARAAGYYEAFLARYPKHPIANDATALLQVIRSGKSMEQIIQEFEQQKQE